MFDFNKNAANKREIVPIESVLKSEVYLNQSSDQLLFPLGKKEDGEVEWLDLAKMGSLLVVGATGTGKSTLLTAMAASFINARLASELQLLIIDPKMVEYTLFEKSPYLYGGKIVYDYQSFMEQLDNISGLIAQRTALFASVGVKNIDEYNAAVGAEQSIGKIVLLIDELADFMMDMLNKMQIESRLVNVIKEGNAAGVYVVAATQCAFFDVITDDIEKSSLHRVAFKCFGDAWLRRFIGNNLPAELNGAGELVYKDSARLIKAQGVYPSMEYVKNLLNDME